MPGNPGLWRADGFCQQLHEMTRLLLSVRPAYGLLMRTWVDAWTSGEIEEGLLFRLSFKD